MKSDLKRLIRGYAILNKLKYEKAHEKVVLGKILAERKELRKGVKEILEEVRKIVREVNTLSKEEIEILKKKISIEEEYDKKRSREKIYEYRYEINLPEEKKQKPKKIRTRMAPNPNGAMTLGSARGIIVNHYLAKKYNGKFILRFDDTDPKTKAPMLEAYQWYLEDCKFLKSEPDEVYYASDRIHLYYPYAEKLIKLGKAYVCFCKAKEFKKLKDKKRECPHRNTPIKENLENWKKMLNGVYKEGEAVLRIKTDMANKDPALRDWVGFRIIETEHPRVKNRYRVWPLLDFESAIEDHLLKVTHIVRGKDLADSERRQKFIYEYFGWKYPKVIHWGRVKIREFGKLSTSGIRKGIEKGEYEGWDDPRLPTIRALKRRGITPEAIRNLILSLGITETDISLSLENLFAENRKIIDKKVNRYFFVPNPVEIVIENLGYVKLKVPLHPNFPERGYREIEVNPKEKIFISKEDAKNFKNGEEIRLMNLCNVKITEKIWKKEKKIIATRLKEKNLKVKKIQWVQSYMLGKILTPEGEIKGFCEDNCKNIKIGETIQFERVGFVVLEEKHEEILKFCFGHT